MRRLLYINVYGAPEGPSEVCIMGFLMKSLGSDRRIVKQSLSSPPPDELCMRRIMLQIEYLSMPASLPWDERICNGTNQLMKCLSSSKCLLKEPLHSFVQTVEPSENSTV